MGVAVGKASHDKLAREHVRKRWGWLEQRIWLPKFIYVLIPYFYLACGISAFLATLYIADWFWLLPHYLLFSFACVHMGIVVYRWRSKPKTNDADIQRMKGADG